MPGDETETIITSVSDNKKQVTTIRSYNQNEDKYQQVGQGYIDQQKQHAGGMFTQMTSFDM